MAYYVVIRKHGTVDVPCGHKHRRHTSAMHCQRLQRRKHPAGVMSDRIGALGGYSVIVVREHGATAR